MAVCAFALLTSCATPNLGGPRAPKDDPDAGTFEFPNGKIVWIRPDDLRYTGTGKFTWPSGRHYNGSFLEGRPHGQGTLDLVDGSRYVGAFEAGMRSGAGGMESSRGSYQGGWLTDAPHGYGELSYDDGAYYAGEWNQGRREGEGSFRRASGSHYQGDWSQDVPHGFGTVREPNGTIYEGQWFAGERSGYGKVMNRAGVTFEGTWRSNRRQGYGLEVRPDGSRYEGEWISGKRQGDGIETSPNGSTHDGVWENNIPLGPGTRHLSTGIEITGLWNGDFVTAGILTLPGNAEYAGNLYDKNNSVVSADLTAWLTKVGSAGNHHAQLMLGDIYSKYVEPPQDLAKAKEWYRRAARGDVPEAMYRIGAILIEQNQAATGVKYLARASDADHPMANLLLGSYYQLGNHVGKDHARARSLYQHATDRGNVVARNNLAWLLATSPNDRVRDGKKAVELIRPIAYLYNNWGYYDTLAAAFAEAGDFSAAKSAQELAVRLAERDSASPKPSVILAMRGRLSLFEAEVAYREN